MTVTRDDLEGKLREIQSAIDEAAAGARQPGVLAAVGVVALVFIVYLFGRRRGRKGGGRIEIVRY